MKRNIVNDQNSSLKGIVLAGGFGTRLYPMTRVISKHLLPVFDKPMIFYPISTLMLAGIKNILVIVTQKDINLYQGLLKDGSQWGIHLEYEIQDHPNGLAEAFIIGEKFLNGGPCCMILADNIFYGHGLIEQLKNGMERKHGATIFAYRVSDPQRYGVVELSEAGAPISIEEKPLYPKSNYAVPGLYVYDNHVVDIAKSLTPSLRGELEITHINQRYLEMGNLWVEKLGRGIAWLDAGTPSALNQAAQLIEAIEVRQGLKVACLEEIAYRLGYIDQRAFEQLILAYGQCDYAHYLEMVLGGK